MGNKVIVLGAGASRGASYALPNTFPSALDSDFFVLLPRLAPGKYSAAVQDVLAWRKSLPPDCRDSMERSFYTLQSRAFLLEKLTSNEMIPNDDEVVASFATCITALLREAHGTRKCEYHERLFQNTSAADTIISFNYDLVVERALEPRGTAANPFGRWLYGLDPCPAGFDLPTVLKLHGSQNWHVEDENIEVLTKDWQGLSLSPGYRGDIGVGTVFPIFLPFWDKRIEKDPWLKIWRLAYSSLKTAESIVVWGYSLPVTDLKAQQLFKLALGDKPFDLCIVDPSAQTRERWRALFPEARYWEYQRIGEFLDYPPTWWMSGGSV